MTQCQIVFTAAAVIGIALDDDFLRPYKGYSGIPFFNFQGNSSYHSLQVSAQRRFAKGFQFGAVYTWSRAMDYGDDDNPGVVTFVSRREFNYGNSAFDRRQIFAVNYLWEAPGKGIGNPVLRAVAGGWQISGITRFQSGAPLRLTAERPMPSRSAALATEPSCTTAMNASTPA